MSSAVAISTNAETGYDLQSFSIIGGADYAWSEDALAGVAFSYSRTSTDFNNYGGGIDADTFQVGFYGLVDDLYTDGLSAQAVLTGGRSNFESSRRIVFTANEMTIDRTAVADFSGYGFNAVGRLQYDLAPLAVDHPYHWAYDWKYFAFVQMDYLYFKSDDYVESGAGGLSLVVKPETYNSLIAEVGLRAEVPVETFVGPLSLFGEGSANFEILDARGITAASFAAVGPAGPEFLVEGDATDHVFGRLTIGATGKLMGADLTLQYETAFSRRFFSEQAVAISLGGPFLGADWLGIDLAGAFAGKEWAGALVNLEYELKF